MNIVITLTYKWVEIVQANTERVGIREERALDRSKVLLKVDQTLPSESSLPPIREALLQVFNGFPAGPHKMELSLYNSFTNEVETAEREFQSPEAVYESLRRWTGAVEAKVNLNIALGNFDRALKSVPSDHADILRSAIDKI